MCELKIRPWAQLGNSWLFPSVRQAEKMEVQSEVRWRINATELVQMKLGQSAI